MRIVNDDGREINIVGLDPRYFNNNAPSVPTNNSRYFYSHKVVKTANIIHEAGAHFNYIDYELQHQFWYSDPYGAFNVFDQESIHAKMLSELKQLYGTLFEE